MTAPDTREKTPLEELGVDSIEEARLLIDVGKKYHNESGFFARKLERLEKKLSERENKVPDDDKDTDPTVRQLRSELRSLRSTVAEMMEGQDEDLKRLKPYLSEVLDEHPDLRGFQNNKTKQKVAKMLAQELYEQDNPDHTKTSVGNRAYREGSGAPVTTGPTRSGGEDELKRRLGQAKTRAEKQSIMDQWVREHPPDED